MSPLIYFLKKSVSDLSCLMFPPICAGCGSLLVENENQICFNCLVDLPRTNFHLEPDNLIEMIFWGRTKIKRASSYFYFRKGAKTQALLHGLKYKGMRDIGVLLGRMYASELLKSGYFDPVDFLVPVPLHPKKEKIRGYNQCLAIAEGMSEISGKPICSTNLVRQKFSDSQTRRGRWDRWENVESLFAVKDPALFQGKHILLIDDVITTGATLEACTNEILKSAGAEVSIATLGYATQ